MVNGNGNGKGKPFALSPSWIPKSTVFWKSYDFCLPNSSWNTIHPRLEFLTFSFILTSPLHLVFCFDFLVWKRKTTKYSCVPVKTVPLLGKFIYLPDKFYSIFNTSFNLQLIYFFKSFFDEFPWFPEYTMHMPTYFCLYVALFAFYGYH